MSDVLHHLQILSIFHYVVGGIIGLVACFPIIHFTIGILIVTGAFDSATQAGGGQGPQSGWEFAPPGRLCTVRHNGWTSHSRNRGLW